MSFAPSSPISKRPRRCIGVEIESLDCRHDAVPGLLGDLRAVVEHSRDQRCHRVVHVYSTWLAQFLLADLPMPCFFTSRVM